MRYELFIGVRYLRARRREAFISLITLISVLGVTIGVSFAEIGEPHEVTVRNGAEERKVSLSGVVVGVELAKQLGVVEGDPLTVILPVGTPSAVGMVPKIKRFVVVGVFDSGIFEFDGAMIYVDIAEAQALVGLKDAVTGIEIRTDDVERAADVAARLDQEVLGFPYEARDWMQMNRNVFIALRLTKVAYFLVLSLMLVVAGFSILATLIMVVMEKRKDIAILKSMGASDASVAAIFVFKGLVIGLLGTLAGNVLGLVLCGFISRYRLPLPKGVFFVQTVPVVIVPEYFIAVTIAAFLICFLVTLYPASRAARVAPVDVLRYE